MAVRGSPTAVALQDSDRQVWFCSRDLCDVRTQADAGGPLGPFRSRDLLTRVGALLRLLRVDAIHVGPTGDPVGQLLVLRIQGALEDLPSAMSIWTSNGHRATLVTLEGDVLEPQGVLTGGSLEGPGKLYGSLSKPTIDVLRPVPSVGRMTEVGSLVCTAPR